MAPYTKRQPLEKQTITVTKVTQYGPVANDALYGFNEPLTPNDFVVGETIDVLVKRSAPTERYPEGKQYIAQIVGKPAVSSSAAPVRTLEAKGIENIQPDAQQYVPKVMPELLKAAVRPGSYGDVNDAKSLRILAQGAYQHALVSPAIATLPFKNADELEAIVADMAERVIKRILAREK
jgi:hypothetical protein